jgi:hypothetical protein
MDNGDGCGGSIDRTDRFVTPLYRDDGPNGLVQRVDRLVRLLDKGDAYGRSSDKLGSTDGSGSVIASRTGRPDRFFGRDLPEVPMNGSCASERKWRWWVNGSRVQRRALVAERETLVLVLVVVLASDIACMHGRRCGGGRCKS